MCGIAGIASAVGAPIDPQRLTAMTTALAHRGPDGSGEWISPDGRVGFGHRRLSILDTSQEGTQPMVSQSGRYTVTYNGEIYNYLSLREELLSRGTVFRGHSDTEVLVAALDCFGISGTLNKIDGMFAFAVWDAHEESLTLIRDRIGIKPLYYCYLLDTQKLLFASELRPIVIARNELPPISGQALMEYMRFGYVPGPLSIFESVYKLPPGSYVVYRQGKISKPQTYWNLVDVARAGMEHPYIDEAEALSALEGTLRSAISSHSIADVPLGAFLSGGIDSTTVVALMQTQSSSRIKTFSIGFHDNEYNEATHAGAVARHLGTDHTELYVTDDDARAVIPRLPEMYDEPFADASQIPTFLVSQLARKRVTVALSGDGGDELFAGYNRYLFVSRFWQKLRHLPISARQAAAAALAAPSPETWDTFFSILPASLRPSTPGLKMHKIAAILPSASLVALHERLVSQWAVPQAVLSRSYRASVIAGNENHVTPTGWDDVTQQMLWDAQTYMVDDILTKVDRASMCVGLEARVPLLDRSVVELAWRIPLSQKIRDGKSKWLLRQLLYNYVPKELIERPKMGFSVPMDAWLRGSLREWAESYLYSKRIDDEGYFDSRLLLQTWNEHGSGRCSRGGPLWTALMFQTWLEKAKTWI